MGAYIIFQVFERPIAGQQSVNFFRAKRMIGQVILVLERVKKIIEIVYNYCL